MTREFNLCDWLLARVKADEHGHLIWTGHCGEAGPQARIEGRVRQVRRYVWSAMHEGRDPGQRWVRPECEIFRCLEPSCLMAHHRRDVMRQAEFKADHALRVAAGKQRAASKLSMQVARALREGRLSPQDVVREYGVHLSMPYRILAGTSWRDLSSPFAGLMDKRVGTVPESAELEGR